MKAPKTKEDLLTRMYEGHRALYEVLSHIPDEHMGEIALYDNWTIKDFIAHIGSWEQTTADRIAALRRGEKVSPVDVDEMNAQFLVRYREMPLNDVRMMEAAAFVAMEKQVNEATDTELFDAKAFPGRKTALCSMVAADTYEHYSEHLDDVRHWMRSIGLD